MATTSKHKKQKNAEQLFCKTCRRERNRLIDTLLNVSSMSYDKDQEEALMQLEFAEREIKKLEKCLGKKLSVAREELKQTKIHVENERYGMSNAYAFTTARTTVDEACK